MDLADVSADFFDKISDTINDLKSDNSKKIIQIYRLIKSVYGQLVSKESRHFSTMLAATAFINDKYELGEVLEKKYYGISGLFRALSKNPKLTASTDELNYTIKYSIEIVKKLSGFELPFEFEQLIKLIPELNLVNKYSVNRDKIEIRGAIVVDNPFYKRKINSHYIELKCKHEETGDFLLKVGYPYLENANMIYPEICINLIDSEIIRYEPLTLSIHSPGIMIFEPDYLIDATELAESYNFNDAFKINFLKRYFKTSVTYPLVLGNLINSLFDEILLKPDTNFETAKNNALKNRPLSVFAIYEKGKLKNSVLNTELHFYFNQIRKFVNEILAVNFQSASFSVEASFISPLYGIQGRLDLLAEYSNDKDRKDIIELKSGSSPATSYAINIGDRKIPIGVWYNHLAQVLAYNLLLESTFSGRKGNSSILYIKTEDKPLRDVAGLKNVVEKLIIHRNNIILLEYAIRNMSFKIFESRSNINYNGLPSYISEKIDLFYSVINNLDETERNFLYEFSSFILRESYAVKTGASLSNNAKGYSALWNDSIEEKIEDNNILINLEINTNESDFNNLHLTFDIPSDNTFTSFRKGDIAILFAYDNIIKANEINNQLLKCTVKSISATKVTVSLRNKLISKSLLKLDSKWRLEPDSIDTIDKISYSSLFTFLRSEKSKRDLILGRTAPKFNENVTEDIEGLNFNQNEIVNRAVNSNDYFLIQGPPGTGKTNVILKNIASQILKNTNENILITAYTNRAVDEISSALSSLELCSDFIRLGSKEACNDYERHLPLIVEKYDMKTAYERLRAARIVVSTVASVLTNQEIFDIKDFDTLIVDEASQILEPQILGLIANTKRFLLIGDEKQLPPVVVQNLQSRKCENKLLNDIGIFDYSISLFERLIKQCSDKNWDFAYSTLTYQARMHNEIQDFPATRFYNNLLKPACEKQFQPQIPFDMNSNNLFEKILATNRIVFIDCEQEKGKINENEAEIALKFIETISSKVEIEPDTIGVIAPFRLQCFEVYKRLSLEQKELITVDTVERFQGSQRDYIILSMSVNSKNLLDRVISQDISGTTDRKLNVAMTRAKSHFILVGNSFLLSQSIHYNDLIEYIKIKGGYYKSYEIT
ncbi:MAG: AAA family ATPase [Candidatus Kapabacteria bacterium]|nr:AAA family ATPase [Ignavibacteriota bacterium]MCW5883717.1 AAA family ATPase [Candidatus Kapabacteria bacterium]